MYLFTTLTRSVTPSSQCLVLRRTSQDAKRLPLYHLLVVLQCTTPSRDRKNRELATCHTPLLFLKTRFTSTELPKGVRCLTTQRTSSQKHAAGSRNTRTVATKQDQLLTRSTRTTQQHGLPRLPQRTDTTWSLPTGEHLRATELRR